MKREWIFYGLVAVGAYLLYRRFVSPVTTAVSAGITSAQDALASGLFKLFGPTDTSSWTYYRVQFPNGAFHAIGNALVNADGRFTWNGYPPGSEADQIMQLVTDSSGAMSAYPVQ